MKLKSLLLTTLMLAIVGIAKAGVVQVGQVAYNCSENVPFNLKYLNSISQQIYYYYDICGSYNAEPFTINTIGFYYEGFNNFYTPTPLDIYMTEYESEDYPLNNNDWGADVPESAKVFSGYVSFKAGDWTTITLDTPYEYSGSDYLLLTINRIGPDAWTSSPSFRTFRSLNYDVRYQYSDNDVYDPTTLRSSYTKLNYDQYVNQIQINGRTIGNSRINHWGLPTGGGKYNISQQIYTREELGASGTIKNLSFYNIGDLIQRNIDIYLVHTSKDSFNGEKDWIDVTSSDKVFSGKVTFKTEDWTQIGLRVPFEYNGTDNLAVIVNDNTGNSWLGMNFLTFPTTSNQALYQFSYDSDFDPTNLTEEGSFPYSPMKNIMKFTIEKKPIQISGNGEAPASTLPIYTNYPYSISEQIYTTSELGAGSKQLTSISFYNTGVEQMRDLDFYLVPTPKASFGNNRDYVNFAEVDLVYSGYVTFYEDDWTTITFDKPYDHKGNMNLVLVVNDRSGEEAPGVNFLAFPTETCQAIFNYRFQQFNAPVEIGEGWGSSSSSRKNSVIFNKEEEDLERPFVLVNPEAFSAQVVWSSDAKKWNLQYREKDSNEWTTVRGLTEKEYELTELKSKTDYRVRVQADYGGSKLSKWTSKEFTTLPAMPTDVSVSVTPNTANVTWRGYGDSYEVNYRKSNKTFFNDFEGITDDKLPDDWTTIDADGDGNNWEVASSHYKPHSGIVCLYSGSVVNNFSVIPDNWLITPQVELKGTLKVWLRNQSGGSWGNEHFAIYASTAGTEISDFVELVPESEASGYYEEYSADLNKFEGQKGYIAFRHFNCSNLSALNLDDICICTDEPEGTWATLSTDETEVTLTGLQPSTSYEVQITSIKAGEPNSTGGTSLFTTMESNPVPSDVRVTPYDYTADVSWKGYSDSYKVQYRTIEREVVDEVIFEDDFENGLDKWTIITNGEHPDGQEGWSTTYIGASNAACSWSYLSSEGVFAADNWLITPRIKLNGFLTFSERGTSNEYFDSFDVLLSTTGNNPNDFKTTIFHLDATAPQWVDVTLDLRQYEGQMGYIAIHHNDYAKDGVLIDDFSITSYKTIPAGNWQTKQSTDTKVTLSGLTPKTPYEYQVIGIKKGETDAVTELKRFTTKNVLFDLVLNTEEDNELIIEENRGKFANVIIKGRTLRKDGKWWTICLPFDVELAGSPLEGADIRTLEDCWLTDDGKYILFDFLTPQDRLYAGFPYIIRWDKGTNIVDPVFKKVIINASDNYISYGPIGFFGIYYNGSTDSDCFYVLNGDLVLSPLIYQYDGIKAFECYFYVDPNITDLYDLKGFGINVGDPEETITGVESVPEVQEVQGGQKAIYNLAGQRLSKMQKGINIVDGKKILVK